MSIDREKATQALQVEISGLKALAESLDEHFDAAVEAIDKMRKGRYGRLIIAGMGKSGHIGRKIAATMASTGTPAHFVHPGEASHGDLGMITDRDVVMMLSNSGENPESSDMIGYAKRFGIPLICITSNADSTMARHADIPLTMPKMPEACPNGLAPTTSTTMTLALGDALAVALLERLNLTPEQFKVFHPGGKLGKKLMHVDELMVASDDLAVVGPSETMDQALIKMTEKNMGCLVVVDENGKLLGIITDGDLKRHMGDGLLSKCVSDVMSVDPKTIRTDVLAAEALDIMLNRFPSPITSLVVANDGRVEGLIRIQECLQVGVA